MNSVRLFWLGQLALWVGFLTAAVATVAWLPPTPLGTPTDWAPWATIPWVVYSLGIAVGAGGCVAIHTSKRQRVHERKQGGDQLNALRAHMAGLVDRLQRLADTVPSTVPESVLDFIEDECQPLFHEFADCRMTIADHYGLSAFAQIMSEVASAERFINRAWSAAADGYLDEVDACVLRALSHIQLAANLFATVDQR